jgi:aminopeptidase-like protein
VKVAALNPTQLRAEIEPAAIGASMHDLIRRLYPICRSITGDGVRQTLRILASHIPLEIKEVPTGTQVFDWTVPREWNIREAWIKGPDGSKVVDFKDSSLHVLNYSVPVHENTNLAELREHLFTLPEQPDWIPYRTSYYSERWGFCMTQNEFDALTEGDYEVFIDSSLEDGSLTYGEFVLPGELADEILLSCHVCHPALCNDNLSGIALVTFLAKHLQSCSRRYTYRFLFIPGTIGAITWLALNEAGARRIQHGLVVACVGDPGALTYKRSRRGTAEIDRAVEYVLGQSDQPSEILDFSPYGYDERQFCSPGFDLAVGSLTRTPHGRYPEYHTSADNPELVQPAALADSFRTYLSVLSVLERNGRFLNRNPKCEPQLGKRGLYSMVGGHSDSKQVELAMLWVLNLSDGHHSLLDIAERADLAFDVITSAAEMLREAELIEPIREAH